APVVKLANTADLKSAPARVAGSIPAGRTQQKNKKGRAVGDPTLGPLSFRAGNGTRTRDPNLGKVVLYQLSYSRAPRNISDVCRARQRSVERGNTVVHPTR